MVSDVAWDESYFVGNNRVNLCPNGGDLNVKDVF
jgi:hypothetical protein